jgi:predicted nucleic-acid-binding Zn-ribbon protein
MKISGYCPKCTSGDLFVVGTVTQPDQDSINGTHATTLFAVWAETGESGLLGKKHGRLHAGTFEAWVCAQCGFTEWYARNANKMLEHLAEQKLGVRRVQPGGGYR